MEWIETPHGVTDRSIEFVRMIIARNPGMQIVAIQGVPENRENKRDEEVVFETMNGDTIRTNGFLWGYAGTAPNGLSRMAQELGFDFVTPEYVARIPTKETFKIHRYCLGCRKYGPLHVAQGIEFDENNQEVRRC